MVFFALFTANIAAYFVDKDKTSEATQVIEHQSLLKSMDEISNKIEDIKGENRLSFEEVGKLSKKSDEIYRMEIKK